MLDRLAESYRRFLAAWVDAMRRGAPLVAALAILSALAAGGYVATHLRINTDTSDMLSPDLEFRRNSRALSEAFPQFSDNIAVAVEGVTPDLADDAALRLVDALSAKPALFRDVYDLAGDPFFRRNGLLYKDEKELADLGDRLAAAQPFLGALWKDPSLRGLAHLLGLAVDEAAGGGGDLPLELGRMLDSLAEVAEARNRGEFLPLSWRDMMEGEAAAKDRRRVFVVRPALDFGSLQPASDAIDAIRETARDLGMTAENGLRVRLTGSAALAQEELKSVADGTGLSNLLAILVVVVLLRIGLRSTRLVAVSLFSLMVGLAWSSAIGLFLVGQFNLLSVAFAVLFIGLSDDFGNHFVLHYREQIDAGHGHSVALRETAASVGGSLALCALSAAIAFFSFLPTDYRGLAELGLIAGTSMFVALIANMTVLPAFLTLLPLGPQHAVPTGEETDPLQAFVCRHARPLAWGAGILGLLSLLTLPWARFDFDPLNLQNPRGEAIRTLFDMMADGNPGPYSITVLAKNLAEADGIAAKLKGLAQVESARTLSDYVPRDQDRKLETLEAMAMFLLPALTDEGRKPPPSDEERAQAFADIKGRMDRLAGTPLETAGARLRRALEAGGEAELERLWLSGLPGRLEALRRALAAGPVVMADLPPGLRAREVAADGRARITVQPKESGRDPAALKRFVEAVRAVAPGATGSPVVILEAGNTVVGAFRQAALLSMALIAMLIALVLRDLRETLLVFAPLVLAALVTVAAMVVLGMPFNFANIIALPLLFGMGVAGGIHLVLRERRESSIAGVLGTSTPRAVFFSTLTTVGAFGALAASEHPGTASMGILLTLAITLVMLCTVFVLPALMVLSPAAKARNEEVRNP
ncbi:MAG: MMPL family transporter [Magnetospirillum sp. WYHS-4]